MALPLVLFATALLFGSARRPRGRGRRPGSNGGGSPPPPGPPPPECTGAQLEGGTVAGVDYLEVVTGGASATQPLPMVIVLHGLGQDMDYMVKFFDAWDVPARVIIPNGFYSRSGGQGGRTWWKGYHPKGLQAFLAEKIPETADRLAPFVETLRLCRPTIGLPIVAGHSMGGYIALEFATSRLGPLVTGVAPSAAWRPEAIWDRVPVKPVYAIHGKRDTGVPYDRSMGYYEEMIARGAPVQIRTVTGSAHRMTQKLATPWREEIQRLLLS